MGSEYEQVRVLIADDQRPTRYGLKALLALSPQTEVIGEAVDGKEAVRLVAERHPDMVLVDVQLPEMNGLEATRHIKCRWPEVRVIALTMYFKYREEALAAGADVFPLKGDTVEALEDAILSQGSGLPGYTRNRQS